jgi:hypothetical protein
VPTDLQLWQQRQQLVCWHVSEVGSLQGNPLVSEDAAIAGDVACRVDVVASDHAYANTGVLAHCNCMRHLSPAANTNQN